MDFKSKLILGIVIGTVVIAGGGAAALAAGHGPAAYNSHVSQVSPQFDQYQLQELLLCVQDPNCEGTITLPNGRTITNHGLGILKTLIGLLGLELPIIIT